MRLFGRNRSPAPDATYPLERPTASDRIDIPFDRYRERLAHALGEVSVLIQDYAHVSNEIVELAERLPPPNKKLQETANQRYLWFFDRQSNWTRTFETQLLATNPPDERLVGIHSDFVEWMISERDSLYYGLASKLYFARGDTYRGMFFDGRIGEIQESRFPLATSLLERLDELATFEPEFFDSIRFPDFTFLLLLLDHFGSVSLGLESITYFPELEDRYPDVAEAIAQFEDSE